MSDETMMEGGVEQEPKKPNGAKVLVGAIVAVALIALIVVWISLTFVKSDVQNRYANTLKSFYTAQVQSDTNAISALVSENFLDKSGFQIIKGAKLSVFVYSISDHTGTNGTLDSKEVLYSVIILNEKPSQGYLNIAVIDKAENNRLVISMISNLYKGIDIME